MPHRSRLAGFIIDCETGEHDAAAKFWSDALGMPLGEKLVEGEARYTGLENARGGLDVAVQQVKHPSRVHLDIEADDQDAEAARLEKLGAKRIGWVRRWWVMEAPTGHRFCIVKMKHPEQGTPPNEWP
ncbi:VOC family protein [Pyxidicoccus xibeiensis]|uniref:VOC family protein n=1 Tax=Pyxidicoccus xibeiensis TaxID=2906759 RepID=UPI0020A77F08|nr:VOC family protein [Pyxidicoccus xibeiensis]MCP3141777.1 VOC family protein [Pyxidicoccus xibeiensis]